MPSGAEIKRGVPFIDIWIAETRERLVEMDRGLMDAIAMMYVYPDGHIAWTTAGTWKGRIHGLFLPKEATEQIWVDHFPELGPINNGNIKENLREFLGRYQYLQTDDLPFKHVDLVRGLKGEYQYTFVHNLPVEPDNPFIACLNQTTSIRKSFTFFPRLVFATQLV